MPLYKKLGAEFFGTFWLVLGGCGSAVLAAKFPEIGIGLVGVALAFGLTVVTMAYAVGRISGGHFNPAITVGLFAGGRTPAGELLPYILAQLAGAIVAEVSVRIPRAVMPSRLRSRPTRKHSTIRPIARPTSVIELPPPPSAAAIRP